MPERKPGPAEAAWILEPPDAAAPRIFGLAPAERLRRALRRAGVARVETRPLDSPPAPPAAGRALLVRADWILDERLVSALAGERNACLAPPPGAGGPAAPAAVADREHFAAALARVRGESSEGAGGLRRVRAEALAPAYDAALRKAAAPVLVPAAAASPRALEDRLFAAAYKGKTDLVTQWVWPAPAAAVTRALALRGVTPNAITLASWALAVAAALLFAVGAFGAGLLAAWLMTFLDTVDGKLARVTLASSRVGHVLDHGLDIVHPPFWWLCWGLGLGLAEHATATAIVVGGYVAGRLLEGAFLLVFDMETHSWRPIDALFRTITARRNPNLLLLSVGTLGGRPDLGLAMVALWTLASLGFHAVRLAQALLQRRRGEAVVPWDAAPAAPQKARPERPAS